MIKTSKNKEYYNALFDNGINKRLYCRTFEEAIILAMAYAIKMRWDEARLFSVTNEIGVVVSHIAPPMYKALKFDRK
jgi:hypothetical protein